MLTDIAIIINMISIINRKAGSVKRWENGCITDELYQTRRPRPKASDVLEAASVDDQVSSALPSIPHEVPYLPEIWDQSTTKSESPILKKGSMQGIISYRI